MVLITHDLGLVAEAADRVAVMYGGRMMERAGRRRYFSRAAASLHGRADLEPAARSIARRRRCIRSRAGAEPGATPTRLRVPSAMRAVERPAALAASRHAAVSGVGPHHRVACHFAEETVQWARAIAPSIGAADAAECPRPTRHRACSQSIEALSKDFHIRRRKGWGRDTLRAVRDVSFAPCAGRTLGLVGKSGCGKSTLGRLILRLIDPSGGVIRLKGDDITTMRPARCGPSGSEMQVVFQDPYASLDPRMTVA